MDSRKIHYMLNEFLMIYRVFLSRIASVHDSVVASGCLQSLPDQPKCTQQPRKTIFVYSSPRMQKHCMHIRMNKVKTTHFLSSNSFIPFCNPFPISFKNNTRQRWTYTLLSLTRQAAELSLFSSTAKYSKPIIE